MHGAGGERFDLEGDGRNGIREGGKETAAGARCYFFAWARVLRVFIRAGYLCRVIISTVYKFIVNETVSKRYLFLRISQP